MTIQDLSHRVPPQAELDPSKIAFGKMFAPNMFVCEYSDGHWRNARLEPLASFQLHPAAIVFHYAQSIFEGLKAFRQADGSVALFRPEKNAKRFHDSAVRMCMPPVPEELFLSAVSEISRVHEDYVPREPGSLYLRPVLMGTEPCIGVRASSDYLFYTIALPSGAYFPEAKGGLGSIDVLVAETVVRAAPGGTGNVKAAANYAVTLHVIAEAKRKHNCAQVLFLDVSHHKRVEEMGGMNIMFVEDGGLVTPPLNSTMLPGVVRDTILSIAKDLGIATHEHAYPGAELFAKLKSGAITEAFACGTAATVTGIANFVTERDERFALPAPGPVSEKLYRQLTGIQYGRLPDKHGWRRVVVEAHSLV